MLAKTVQIAWHKSQSIASIDFCPSPSPLNTHTHSLKFATAGQDNAVRLWSIAQDPNPNASQHSVSVTFLSTLHGHLAGVNIVRWSPTGAPRLASADNAGSIVLWSPSPTPSLLASLAGDADEDPNDYKEHWRSTHVLQGHTDEVNDLAWSPCGKYLASVGTDQTLRVWQVPAGCSGSAGNSSSGGGGGGSGGGASGSGQVIGSAHDHSDVIQGVAWDPRGQLIATQAVDRSVYVYAITLQAVPGAAGRKVAVLKKVAECKNGPSGKLYSDPTSTPTSFFRRLAFSPDGSLLVTPAGLVPLAAPSPAASDPNTPGPATTQQQQQQQHAVHVYTRTHVALAQPTLSLPGYASPAWCIRFCPSFFHHPATSTAPSRTLALPYRMLFAVGSDDALVLYDSHNLHLPLAVLKNLHVYRYQDVAWSPDGRYLVAASHDGYCSLVALTSGECLGEANEWLRRVHAGESEYPVGMGLASVLVSASASANNSTAAAAAVAAAPAPVAAQVLQQQASVPQPHVHVLQVKKKRIQPTLISSFAPLDSATAPLASGPGSSTSGQ